MLTTDTRKGLFHILTTDIYLGMELRQQKTVRMMQCLRDSRVNPTGMEKTRAVLFENQMKGNPQLTLYFGKV